MRRPPADVRAAPARRHVVLLAVAVVVVYANSLANPFVLDDEAAIVQNPTIRSLTDLGAVLRPVPDSPVAGRPLVNLSFAINYAAGGLDPRGYRAWNMGVHLMCALLAFALIRHTLALPRVRRHLDADEGTLAFGAALLWAVHPLNSEVVNYLSQRTESMMAGCLLLAMYASARAIGRTGPADAPPPAAWRWTAILVCALGALCKESIAIAPALVVLY